MEETMKALVAGNSGYSRKDFGFEHQQQSELYSKDFGEVFHFFNLGSQFSNFFVKNGFCIELRSPDNYKSEVTRTAANVMVREGGEGAYTYIGRSCLQYKVTAQRVLFILDTAPIGGLLRNRFAAFVKNCDGTDCEQCAAAG
jgi:hypothetical protein